MAFSDWMIIGALGMFIKKGLENVAEEKERRERECRQYEEDAKNVKLRQSDGMMLRQNARTHLANLRMGMILVSVSDICSIITVAALLCGAAYKIGFEIGKNAKK